MCRPVSCEADVQTSLNAALNELRPITLIQFTRLSTPKHTERHRALTLIVMVSLFCAFSISPDQSHFRSSASSRCSLFAFRNFTLLWKQRCRNRGLLRPSLFRRQRSFFAHLEVLCALLGSDWLYLRNCPRLRVQFDQSHLRYWKKL